MSSNRSRNAMLAFILATLLAAAGCTETEKLQSGVEVLTVEMQLVNTETRFDSAYFEIRQVALRPLDSDADQALTADAIGALRVAMAASYRTTQTLYATAALNAGVYRVAWIVLAAIAYRDSDPPASTETCQEYVSTWRLTTSLTIDDFGEEVLVTIEPSGDNTLTLVVDGEALEDAFLNSWNCAQGYACGYPPVPWCLTTFRSTDFKAQVSDFLDFPSQ